MTTLRAQGSCLDVVIRDVDTWPRVCLRSQEAGLSPNPFYKPVIQSYQHQIEPMVSVNILLHGRELETQGSVPVLIDVQCSRDLGHRFKQNQEGTWQITGAPWWVDWREMLKRIPQGPSDCKLGAFGATPTDQCTLDLKN